MRLAMGFVAACALLIGCGSDHPAPLAQGDASTDTSDAKLDVGGPVCIGPTPPASAFGAKPGPVVVVPDAGDADEAGVDSAVDDASDAAPTSKPTDLGAPAPTCTLTDFQPQSCGFKATYSLEPFKGKVTVAALLAGW